MTTGGRTTTRRQAHRAAFAAVVVAATTFALAPAPVDAASPTCTAAPCVELVVHPAGAKPTSTFLSGAELRALGDSQGDLQGAGFAKLAEQAGLAGYQRVAVRQPGDRAAAPATLERAVAEGSGADGDRPIVFFDGTSVGYAPSGDAAESVRAAPGQNLSVDLYESGSPLTGVRVQGPDRVTVGRPATFTATPAGARFYRFAFSDGTVVGLRPGASVEHTFTTRAKQGYSVFVEVVTADGSFGASADTTGTIGAAPRPTPTPTATSGSGGNGSGGSGGGTGSGGTGGGSGNGSGGLGSGGYSPIDPRYGTPPTDPFRVPPSADGLLETELPSLDATGGSEQVSGLVLTAADGSGGQLSDLDPTQRDTTTDQQRGLGPASPVAVALLIAGVLLVLVASAASELTGLSLSPPTRPRRTPRDR